MRIWINDTWHNLPSTLSEITLKQRIDFQITHGNLLDEMQKSILEIKDEDERELEIANFQIEKMYRSISFFLNIDLDALKNSEFIDQIVHAYVSSLDLVLREEQEIIENPVYEFTWNKEEWVLSHPELTYGHKMKFGEFIDSKQMIQDMINLGKSRWECLIPLAAIFLRKSGEQYEASFLHEGSDRLKLMESLPLNIALQVAFFLTNSLSMFINSSQFSFLQELKEQENLSKTT